MYNLTRSLALATIATSLMMVGCNKDIRHSHKGRIDPTYTTKGEMRDERISPVALIEFSDQAPQTFSRRINETPHVRKINGPITVILGDINNKTGIVSSTDFEMMTQRLRSNLLASQYMRDRIKFVENRARMRRLKARELGVPESEIPEPKYDINTSFFLNGDMFRVGRGKTNLYYMQVQLTHAASNEIVFNDRFDIKQIEVK